ncbi:M23 family metallopeptidase [Bartonella sp. CB60]|uniref:M23 family metallopeptidase n=1 Tax=Bartonella sp. CB60 TaxID=3113619 RepID=UPI00300DDDA3
MYFKTLGNIFQRNFQCIAFLVITMIIAGCSSGTQRFDNFFSHHAVSARSDESAVFSDDPQMLSYGDMIQSTELPPVESSSDQWSYDSTPYNSSIQGRESVSDGQIIGEPPRNLGTLSRSQVSDTSVVRKNSYIVQSGDTLLSIAHQTGVSIDTLKLANGIKNNSIYIGQILTIPSKRTVADSNATNNNLFASAQKSSFQARSSKKYEKIPPTYKKPAPVVPSEKIRKSDIQKNSSQQMIALSHGNGLSDTVPRTNNKLPLQATGISKMRWPVRGRLLSQFGQKKGTEINRGIDIAVPVGSSVKAAENGVVIYASDGLKDLGNVVMIRHEDDIITVYGYNSKLVVNRGQRIRRGDEIAKSGVSGNVKTPRVHFEVRKNRIPVDPIKYLEN